MGFITIFFITILLFSFLLNKILLRFSSNLGIREKFPELERWSSAQKPSLGGITFYITFLISIMSYAIFVDEDNAFRSSELMLIVLGTTMAFLMGLADDAYNTKPFLKFTVQTLCGVILIYSGNSIEWFSHDIINITLTILWTIGIMNSINMLDNMDGITSLVSIFILATILLYLGFNSGTSSVDFVIILGAIASLIAFLFFNFHPSKMFMGDTGSQFLGFTLAFVSIKFLWNAGAEVSFTLDRQLVLVLVTFILPLIDTIIVVVNRLKRGQSPFVGGKDHTTHNLSYLGLSDRQVAYVFISISLISSVLAQYIFVITENWTFYHSLSFISYFILIFSLFFYITRYNLKRGKGK